MNAKWVLLLTVCLHSANCWVDDEPEESQFIEKRDSEKEAGGRTADKDGKFNGKYNGDCSETMLLTSRKPSKIEPDKDEIDKPTNRCHWDIIGTETCKPILDCKKFKLEPPGSTGECEKEYLQVSDGIKGYERYCGETGPQNVTSANPVFRDLYITFQSAEKPISGKGLKCTVTCGTAEDPAKPLGDNFSEESNDKCNCGRKPNNDRIVGGVDAKKGEFPWIAGLVTAGTRKPYCGGTLINDRFIITAAHCFKGPYTKAVNFQILLNGHLMDLTESKVAHGGGDSTDKMTAEELAAADTKDSAVRFDVDKYYIHPLYVKQTNDYDVALIKLKTPVDFGKHKLVTSACMPDVDPKTIYEGKWATVAGWGLNNASADTTMATLQKLDVEVFPATECKEIFGDRFSKRMMCAGYREGNKDSCKGDSGGPLVSEKKKQVFQIIGTVSWGEGCAGKRSPGVYIRLPEVLQWVRYITNMEDAVWCAD